MLNIIIILLLAILFYRLKKKENFNILNKYKKIHKRNKRNKKDLELLIKILYYIKSFEKTDINMISCSNKYKSFDELFKYNNDIINSNKTFIGKKLWKQNNKLNFCQDLIDNDEINNCLDEKYNERLEHGKDLMKKLNNKANWIQEYENLYSIDNIEKKYESNEINSNNIFYIYRLHSLLYELSQNYKIDDKKISFNNLSKTKSKPLLVNLDVLTLLEILLNTNIPSKNDLLIKEIIKKNYIKENNIDISTIMNKITKIGKMINNLNIMSCDFISFDYTKN